MNMFGSSSGGGYTNYLLTDEILDKVEFIKL
jgi:hypothetical protein